MVNHTLQGNIFLQSPILISNISLHLHPHQQQHLKSIISVVLYQKILLQQLNPTVPIDDDFTQISFFFSSIYYTYSPFHGFLFFIVCMFIPSPFFNHLNISPQNNDHACALISFFWFIQHFIVMNCLDYQSHDRNTLVIEHHSCLQSR